MREIKFKAYDKLTKRIYCVWAINSDNSVDMATNGLLVKGVFKRKRDEVELIQFTGLKDRKGIDIYEGDIVIDNCIDLVKNNIEDRFKYSRLHEVYFDKGCFMVTNIKSCHFPLLIEVVLYTDLEIIGNIYENPELRENKKNEL